MPNFVIARNTRNGSALTSFYVTQRLQTSLICFIFAVFTPTAIGAQESVPIELRVALDENIIAKHPNILEGNICENLIGYQSNFDRPPVDLVLICRTLEIAETQTSIKILPSPSYARSVRMVKKGLAHTMAESVWFSDIDSDYMYHTGPVLEIGDIEKGIYVPVEHPLLSSWQDVLQLKNLTGITLSRWTHDWDIISSLTDDVVPTSNYESLIKMLNAGRGDFTLHEFSQSEDLDIVAHSIWLKPIPGIKVVMPESRVIPISAEAENASKIAYIIKSGVQKLNANGEVNTLYSAVGFNNPAVKDWKIINLPVLADY